MKVNVRRVETPRHGATASATGIVDLMDVIDQYAREADAKDIECNVPKPGATRRHIGRPEWEQPTATPTATNALARSADTNTNTSGNIFVGITEMLRRSGQLGR